MATKTETTASEKVARSRKNSTYSLMSDDWLSFEPTSKVGDTKCFISPIDWRLKYHELRQEVDNRGYDFEERISIPLLDWEQYQRFRKSWIYEVWRRLNGN